MPHGEVLAFGVPIVTLEVFNFLDASNIQLQCEAWSNEARTVQIRGFTRHGFISHDHVTNADRSVSTTVFDLQDYPLNFQCRTTDTSVRKGELYVRITLQMGGFDVACLLAGYVTDQNFPSYPAHSPQDAIEGGGNIRSIAGTNPAAGAEISETVPTNARWRLLGIIASYVADGTAASRGPNLSIDDGATELIRVQSTAALTAGQTDIISWSLLGANTSMSGVLVSAMLPGDLILEQGFRIRTITNNLQAGDNWGAPQLLVEEWLEE